MPERVQRRRIKGQKGIPDGATYVGRPSKWGNPFAIGSPSGLKRIPAVGYPDQPWEYEGRISAAGNDHPYYHPDGRIIRCRVWAMTPAESVQCYRAYIAGGGWPIDWKPYGAPTLDEIRAELAGHDLACWCPLVDQYGQRVPCHADVLLELANQEVAA